MLKKWNRLESRRLIEHPLFSLDTIHCRNEKLDTEHDFLVLQSPDWINIVAVTEEGQYILVRQHRLGTDAITLETPGGVVNPDEPPHLTAERELREETGYRAGSLFHIMSVPVNPAIMNNTIHYYYATECVLEGNQDLDPAEDIETVLLQKEELLQLLKEGATFNALVTTAITLHLLAEDGEEVPRIHPTAL